MTDYRLLSLTIENFEGIEFLDITPPENGLIPIEGINEAGKSSLIKAIHVLLCGGYVSPKQPIKEGNYKALVEGKLGPYTITRKFTEKGMYLDVMKDGAKQTRPQEFLDDLLVDNGGVIAFNPLRFMGSTSAKDNAQRKSLLLKAFQIPSPDKEFLEIIGQEPLGENVIEKFSSANQIVKDKAKEIRVIKKHTEPKLKTLTLIEVTDEHDVGKLNQTRDKYIKENADIERLNEDINSTQNKLQHINMIVDEKYTHIESAKTEYKQKVNNIETKTQTRLNRLEDNFHQKLQELETWKQNETKTIQSQKQEYIENTLKAHQLVLQGHQTGISEYQKQKDYFNTLADAELKPLHDLKEIEFKISEAQTVKARYFEYLEQKQLHDDFQKLVEQEKSFKSKIEQLQKLKTKCLKQNKSPIKGLSFDNDGNFLYKNHPLEQASTSKLIRLATAIYLYLEPKIKIMLIERGNDLDKKTLKLLEAVAKNKGLQIWLERVSETYNGKGFFMREGRVVQGQ